MFGLGSMRRSGLGCTRLHPTRGGGRVCITGWMPVVWVGMHRAGRVVMRCVGMPRKQRSLGAHVACALGEYRG